MRHSAFRSEPPKQYKNDNDDRDEADDADATVTTPVVVSSWVALLFIVHQSAKRARHSLIPRERNDSAL
jgi:hypothetical protein